jgi:hypothetical protein
MLYRLILPEWAKKESWNPRALPPVVEADLTEEELNDYNLKGYNCYAIINTSSNFKPGLKDANGKPIYLKGEEIDIFTHCFADFDLKDETYPSKEAFIEFLKSQDLKPSAIIDSGNGVHVYWYVKDLDANSYIRLQRRIARFYKTDDKVCTIYRLMRVPNTYNTKEENNFKWCSVLESDETIEYTCEEMDKFLPPILPEDEEYCVTHYNQTYNMSNMDTNVSDEIPLKFQTLMKENDEVSRLFFGPVQDRSSADFRLAHLLKTKDFSKEDGMAVLLNTGKAISRSKMHRYNYANNIVEKVWGYEEKKEEVVSTIAKSVEDILKADKKDRGARIYGHPMFDAHFKGFRLGEVFGLVGGSGIGKTTLTSNHFKWFVERNPDLIHVFISLEEPEENIAEKWALICGENKALHSKVKIIGNRDENNLTRKFSLYELRDQIFNIEKIFKQKVGCVVIDHIGVLLQKGSDGRYYREKGLEQVCADMQAFAQSTNTFLIMLSQTSRSKAGWGDIELDKDAAFGTVFFESYCDYLMTTWQPLKRVYKEAPHMTINAFKYCKIRPKTLGKDNIYEDQVYGMMFDPANSNLRQLTSEEEKAYQFWIKQAVNKRNADKKRDINPLQTMDWDVKGDVNGRSTNNSK